MYLILEIEITACKKEKMSSVIKIIYFTVGTRKSLTRTELI